MIELQHLTKRFATQGGTVIALNDINLTIRDGDVYGIIGMSGAGKSTLVRCINMLERPDEGKVIVNGVYAPIAGTICMDMCMIDLTDRPSVDVGDEVEIFGPRNPVETMAAQAGTIPYELTCAVSKRVPRVYLQNGQVTERELLLRF